MALYVPLCRRTQFIRNDKRNPYYGRSTGSISNDFLTSLANGNAEKAVSSFGEFFGGLVNNGVGTLGSQSYLRPRSQGRNDAITLQSRYYSEGRGCDSPVIKTVMANLIKRFGTEDVYKEDTTRDNQQQAESTQPDRAAYQKGFNDAVAYNDWLNTLSGDERDGALWWASVRNDKVEHDCAEKAALSNDYQKGCLDVNSGAKRGH